MIRVKDQVVFKQRVARHLAICSELSWQYEYGNIISIDEEQANVCWLQGHHSRNDDVPIKDIVAVYDKNEPSISIGGIRGCSKVLQEIVEEGTD